MNNLSNFFRVLGSALFVVVFSSRATAQETTPTVTWRLPADVQVDSSGIFLSQTVLSTPPVVLPQIRLAPAPLLGQTTFFSRDQIIAMVQTNVPELNTTNWTGPARVRVGRRTRQLGDSELCDLLTATLQRDYVKDLGELELHLARPWAAVTVPDELLSVTMTEVPSVGVLPNFVAGFELWNGKERVGRWQVVLQAKVWRQAPLAHSPLLRGQLLRDADITLDRRDVLVSRELLLSYNKDDSTLELTENLPAGVPLMNHSVRVRPLIRRGQLVDGVFTDGSLRISLKVESLEDGVLGQIVRVRNPKTKRELSGKVQNEEIVSISL